MKAPELVFKMVPFRSIVGAKEGVPMTLLEAQRGVEVLIPEGEGIPWSAIRVSKDDSMTC
jgi:hypothetical protein